MQIPIPDDWSGEEWQCYTVMWPNSPQWRSLLRGLLLSPKRGRFWDERSGSVIQAQIVGLEIDHRNLPLRTCDGLIVPCFEPSIEPGSAFDLDELLFCSCEDEEMACTDCPPIKIENGQLFWFNCGEWQLVGDIGGAAQPEVVDPWPNDDQGNPPTFSACGKAKAVYDAIMAVANGFNDAGDELPWKWVGTVQSALPGYNLKDTWVVSGVINMINLLALYELGEIFDTFNGGQVLCRLVNLFGADQEGLSSSQFDQIKSAFVGEFGLILSQPFTVAANAIGVNSLSQIAKLGATDTTSDCGCPEPPPEEGETPTEPTANGWYLSEVKGSATALLPADRTDCRLYAWQNDKEVFGIVFDAVAVNGDWLTQAAPIVTGEVRTGGGRSGGFNNVTNFFYGPPSIATEIFGGAAGWFDGYTNGNCNYVSTNPAAPSSPGVYQAHVVQGAEVAFNGPTTLTISNIRLVHNVNSAHGAQ